MANHQRPSELDELLEQLIQSGQATFYPLHRYALRCWGCRKLCQEPDGLILVVLCPECRKRFLKPEEIEGEE